MKQRWLYRHGLGWLAYSGYLWVGAVLSGKPLERSGWLVGSFVALGAPTFYLCYGWLFPRVLQPGHRKGWRLTLALAGAVALYIGMRYAVEEMLYPLLLGFHNYYPGATVRYYLLDNLYYAAPVVLLSAVVWEFETALHRERENQQLRQEKAQAEEAFLRTQLHPHFLYNTLNLLYTLAYPVQGPLANALLQVAELMRYQLRRSLDGKVALAEEVSFLTQYIGLYQLRFAGKCHVQFNLTGEPIQQQRLPPLLLVPFVENALKHGILHRPETPVRISVHLSADSTLTLEVQNFIGPHHKDSVGGIGLPNVRRRLALLFPACHQLQVGPTATGEFGVRLQLQLA